MSKNTSLEIGLIEGRTYIIGREGHIYIDCPTVSKQHAEIKIINGRIYLRDLNYTVQDLLAIACDFIGSDDAATQVNFTNLKVNSRG